MCHMSRVPTPRDPFGIPSEHATCPKAHTERPLRNSFGACHVSRKPHRETPSEFLRSVPRVPKATPRDPFGFLRSMPRVPKATPRDPFGFLRSMPCVPEAHTERPLWIPSECDTCPGWLKPFPTDLSNSRNSLELCKCILNGIKLGKI